MKAILSIRPEYVKKIISGEKTYEFRKKIFKQDIESVIIYSTKPDGHFIGEFKVNNIIQGDKKNVWSKTKSNSGITKKFFEEYFKNTEVAYALEINDLLIYGKPIDPSTIFPNFKAPQSFCYLKESII